MSVLPILIVAMITLGCLYLVINPLLRGDVQLVSAPSTVNEEKIDTRALYQTLNEIEFDFKMNKISEEDYKRLSRQYETIISQQMQSIQETKPETRKDKISEVTEIKVNTKSVDLEDEIEKELQSYMKKKGGR